MKLFTKTHNFRIILVKIRKQFPDKLLELLERHIAFNLS